MRPPPVVWDPSYEIDIGAHVFVTAKYRLTRERLLAQGTLRDDDFVAPVPATREQLALVHTPAYLEKVYSGTFSFADVLRLEVPFSEEGRSAMVLMCGGTLHAARLALEHGVAAHLGGGFHHAFAGHGEGFCLLNDVAVAARALLEEGMVRRPAIIDLDVHHGNGTAAIFADDPAVFTFSMHQENNYPATKPPSDLDVGLEDGTDDAQYLALLDEHLPRVLGGHQPDLVLYLAGADPYREDQLGGLALTIEGLRRRDRAVIEMTRDRAVPIAVVLAGGYARRPDDTVTIHAATIEELVRSARGATNERTYYRVRYPGSARPRLVTADRTLEVVECSESGLRFLLPKQEPPPAIGARVRGLLTFGERSEVEVAGVVARVGGGTAALRLSEAPIPFGTILREQHWLRRHYLDQR